MEIYKITNIDNGKIYVGKAVNAQTRFHKHKLNASNKINRPLYDAMNHHGYDKFFVDIIESNLDKSIINDREKFWIETLNSKFPNGYNMTDGGDGGNTLEKWTEEERKALYKQQGESRKGRVVSPETRAKISKFNKGRIISEETIQKMKISLRNYYKNTGVRPKTCYQWLGVKGESHPLFGFHHSKESKEKMSRARKGKKMIDILGGDEVALAKFLSTRRDISGKNNPLWVAKPSDEKILELCKYLKTHQNTSMEYISNFLGVSQFISRSILRKVGIKNLQVLRYLPNQQWHNFFDELINFYVNKSS